MTRDFDLTLLAIVHSDIYIYIFSCLMKLYFFCLNNFLLKVDEMAVLYEEAFTKMKRAAGVSSTQEVVKRLNFIIFIFPKF